MAFQWRNNPMALLHGAAGPEHPPSYSDWMLWTNGTERCMGAVGALYITRMIEDLDWDGAGLPVFLQIHDDPATAPTLISDHKSLDYKKEILKLAVAAGRHFSVANPLETDAAVNEHYTQVETEIISFGSQLFEKTKTHFSTVFTDTSRKHFNLKPLLEWKVIEKLINPKAEVDVGQSWVELGNLVQLEPEMNETWLTDWLSKITQHRNDLVPSKGAEAVDSLIITNIIACIKHANLDLTKAGSIDWKMLAIDWHKEYYKKPALFSFEKLKHSIFEQIGEQKNANLGSSTTEAGGMKRPRLNPAVPQGMALAAGVEEGLIQAAVQAALSAVQLREQQMRAQDSSPPQQQQQPFSPQQQHTSQRDPRCSNCGGLGHWKAVCPSPPRQQGPRGVEQQQRSQQQGFGQPPPRFSSKYGPHRGRGAQHAMRGGRGGPPGFTRNASNPNANATAQGAGYAPQQTPSFLQNTQPQMQQAGAVAQQQQHTRTTPKQHTLQVYAVFTHKLTQRQHP
mmetsp:Transcript_61735/g.127602  ORF Transcript_61735/g.127602 Transcript_61735/m.127602 type:complete len:508 (+) Transcript_61735:1927-3450(+)